MTLCLFNGIKTGLSLGKRYVSLLQAHGPLHNSGIYTIHVYKSPSVSDLQNLRKSLLKPLLKAKLHFFCLSLSLLFNDIARIKQGEVD